MRGASWSSPPAAGSRCTRVKVTGLAQTLGQLEAVHRDLQSNIGPTCDFWANTVTLTLPRHKSLSVGPARGPRRRTPTPESLHQGLHRGSGVGILSQKRWVKSRDAGYLASPVKGTFTPPVTASSAAWRPPRLATWPNDGGTVMLHHHLRPLIVLLDAKRCGRYEAECQRGPRRSLATARDSVVRCVIIWFNL